ncbi:MAG TPA: YicC/YloC family endoribonuclease, partial [Planctomycetota bacterium]|nr:YicC/YloC family endoribonuclease [Planctomycetota bacterium]
MTGFGSASQRDRRFDVEVEIRSVNHRFLTLKQSLPEEFSRREGELEQLVRERLSRGSLTLSVTVKAAADEEDLLPGLDRLKDTAKRLRGVQKALGLKGELSLENLLAVPALWRDGGPSFPAE